MTAERAQTGQQVLAWGALSLDLERHHVEMEGRALDLTLTEFRLLTMLLAGKGRVVTREEIFREVWGPGEEGRPRALDVHMRRLRGKLGECSPASIVTIRKVGYRLAAKGGGGS